jgi:hypothetical protein
LLLALVHASLAFFDLGLIIVLGAESVDLCRSLKHCCRSLVARSFARSTLLYLAAISESLPTRLALLCYESGECSSHSCLLRRPTHFRTIGVVNTAMIFFAVFCKSVVG